MRLPELHRMTCAGALRQSMQRRLRPTRRASLSHSAVCWGWDRLAARGDTDAIVALRTHASDVRWRVREAAATALQLWGDEDLARMLATARDWASGNRFEQRAAVAAVAEPRLLKERTAGEAAVALVDGVTTSLVAATDARSEPFHVLRQALGYAWSVVIVGAPAAGKPRFTSWAGSTDPQHPLDCAREPEKGAPRTAGFGMGDAVARCNCGIG